MNDFDTGVMELEPERYELREAPRYRFELGRRDLLKGLGGGILVCCLVESAEAQQPGGRRGGGSGGRRDAPREIGAWLHIGEDGRIAVFTGKAEVGQNIRTSLAQAVAEELHTPLSSIEMVMADTERTPFDMGTFGSRTTPDMSPRLRHAAAVAREMLFELAAERWKVDRSLLAALDGAIINKETRESLAFGKLTHGQKLTKTVADTAPLSSPEKWTTAGHSAPKVDGRDFVTGKHRYASDVRLPGMLHGKVLRPTSFGAKLISIDLAAAKAIPDVVVVHDGDFVGVAAPSEQLAARAIQAIRADWRPGPPISAKTLFDDLKKPVGARPSGGDGQQRGGRGGSTAPPGSIKTGMDKADVRLDQTYTVAYIAHAPLEPRAAVAQWENGKLTVWTGTQRPFGVRGELTGAFGMPDANVRVIVPDTGAGYGGKHTGEAAIEAARLARAAGKPVKLVWSREEEFTWAYFRPAGVIDVKAGARRDGSLTAWEFHNYNSGRSGIESPYDVPNHFWADHPARAPLRQGSYRALASTANHFARESSMDDLAHALGIDPLAFRLKNLKPRTERGSGQPNVDPSRLRAVLQAAAAAFGWGKKPGSDHGVGLAAGFEKGGYIATCAEVEVDRSTGRIRVIRATSAFECGTIINPDHLKNQVEGALVMGLGGALFEAIDYEKGHITNPRFSRYRVPRFRDTPTIDVVLLDRKDLPSAGAGETPIVAIAPAIGNAVFNATGVRIRSLPMAAHLLKV